jgi:hypothetical protein
MQPAVGAANGKMLRPGQEIERPTGATLASCRARVSQPRTLRYSLRRGHEPRAEPLFGCGPAAVGFVLRFLVLV